MFTYSFIFSCTRLQRIQRSNDEYEAWLSTHSRILHCRTVYSVDNSARLIDDRLDIYHMKESLNSYVQENSESRIEDRSITQDSIEAANNNLFWKSESMKSQLWHWRKQRIRWDLSSWVFTQHTVKLYKYKETLILRAFSCVIIQWLLNESSRERFDVASSIWWKHDVHSRFSSVV